MILHGATFSSTLKIYFRGEVEILLSSSFIKIVKTLKPIVDCTGNPRKIEVCCFLSDVDECSKAHAVKMNGCHPNASCTNTQGS